MIGDKIKLSERNISLAQNLLQGMLAHQLVDDFKGKCISIGGESGCGKTTLSHAFMSVLLDSYELQPFIFHLDDYFKLPPLDNHTERVRNISRVGMEEVDMDALDQHILQIKQKQIEFIHKPLMDYHNNERKFEKIITEHIDVVIVEGTYVTTLEHSDIRLFIDMDYQKTLPWRQERNRGNELGEFIEKVLEIEHLIIKEHKSMADCIISYEGQHSFIKQSK